MLADALHERHFAPEPELLLPLAQQVRLDAETMRRVRVRAQALVDAMRRAAADEGLVGRFMHEYRLSSAEGLVLMCLAEAFLRVPDVQTADLLLRDKLGEVDWGERLGRSPSWSVEAATLALALAGRLLDGGSAGVLQGLVERLGEPMIRKAVGSAMRLMGAHFVMGATIEEALQRAAPAEADGFRHSYDMLGEGARTTADAERYRAAYRHAIERVGAAGGRAPAVAAASVSIKLSALHPRYEPAQQTRVMRELVPALLSLAEAARARGIGLTVDAEEAERLELSLAVFEAVAAAPSLAGWDGLGLAVQAYQKRALPVIRWADDLGRRCRRRIVLRLVKGAYWDSEIKRAQERGLPGYPVYTRKSATDVSYLACAREMLGCTHLFPAFATHNALTAATLLEWAGERRDFEFQRLHGMGRGLYETLLAQDRTLACRTYAPVGDYRELLPYLVRRLLENGANTSFVHLVQEADAPAESLLADPAERVIARGGAPHPEIPLPRDLYGAGRVNAAGIEFGDSVTVRRLMDALQRAWAGRWEACSLLGGTAVRGRCLEVVDPSDTGRVVGEAWHASAADAARALALARAAQPQWGAVPAPERAACLRRAADLLEARCAEFMAVAVREAGKTLPDALAEVREAVDFLRYYALRAEEDFRPLALPGPVGERNELTLAGRGVFACISPWNFPLAIFTGQVAAALAAGNAVVAKPAPQTPIMAYRAVTLLHEAGVPPAVLHLVLGGAEAGAALITDGGPDGVAFTGSTATAKTIARALAAGNGPIVPLIAETGGQNAMIVDSSALPEQAVRDLVVSAFHSAGQRCSAARVLFVQEDIAGRVLEMLAGAMDELALGDPGELATDVGPVIDAQALARLEAHVAAMGKRVMHRVAAPGGGWFFGPTLIGIDSLNELRGEVFGPVLHVARWRAGELDRVIDAVNATGYGLTLGVHSRIDRTVKRVRERARVGNLYVNRSMIGAVVGVQPFGGEGLSGTGPKAGGPHYLRRFATERVLTVDTTSSGGNASLMSMACV